MSFAWEIAAWLGGAGVVVGGAGGNNPDGRKGIPHRTAGHWTNPAEHDGSVWFDTGPSSLSSASSKRKFASAMIAKIPLPLSRHIAATFKPIEHRSAS